MRTRILLLLFIFLISPAAHLVVAGEPGSAQPSPVETTAKPYDARNGKYAGYSMDGVTSASKLAAQRSHTVAGEDERNFAVFTGIVVISIVIFVAQIILNKK